MTRHTKKKGGGNQLRKSPSSSTPFCGWKRTTRRRAVKELCAELSQWIGCSFLVSFHCKYLDNSAGDRNHNATHAKRSGVNPGQADVPQPKKAQRTVRNAVFKRDFKSNLLPLPDFQITTQFVQFSSAFQPPSRTTLFFPGSRYCFAWWVHQAWLTGGVSGM